MSLYISPLKLCLPLIFSTFNFRPFNFSHPMLQDFVPFNFRHPLKVCKKVCLKNCNNLQQIYQQVRICSYQDIWDLYFLSTKALKFALRYASRGFHVYRSIWKPRIEKILRMKPEYANVRNMFAIAMIITSLQETLTAYGVVFTF